VSIGPVLFRRFEDAANMYMSAAEVEAAISFLCADGVTEELRKTSEPVPETDPASWTPDRVFTLCDKDNSGSLDIEELEFALTSVLGKIVTRDEIDKLMKKHDTDGNGSLDREEFAVFVTALRKSKKSISNRLSFKSKSKKEMEKAHVAAERDKLAQREATIMKSPPPGPTAAAPPSSAAGASKSAPSSTADGSLPYMSSGTRAALKTVMDFVETYSDSEVGLYRRSGDHAVVKALTASIASGEALASEQMPVITENDVHAAAGAVKKVLSTHLPLIPSGTPPPLPPAPTAPFQSQTIH
jgi:hypothetical protein